MRSKFSDRLSHAGSDDDEDDDDAAHRDINDDEEKDDESSEDMGWLRRRASQRIHPATYRPTKVCFFLIFNFRNVNKQ